MMHLNQSQVAITFIFFFQNCTHCTISHQRMPDNLQRQALKSISACLGLVIFFTICWVANSFVAVQAVWRDYPALVAQMKKAAEDESRSDGEIKEFNGLLNRLTCTGFVKGLATIKIQVGIVFLLLKSEQENYVVKVVFNA